MKKWKKLKYEYFHWIIQNLSPLMPIAVFGRTEKHNFSCNQITMNCADFFAVNLANL